MDTFEQDYGTPHCPYCGNNAVTFEEEKHYGYDSDRHACADYACESCKMYLDSSEVFSDELLGFSYESGGYQLCDCLDSDVFVIKSPYYTFAQFCSPCVPGAGNLDNPMPDGIKTFCLGHDWFEETRAPYPVYSVETGKEINPA